MTRPPFNPDDIDPADVPDVEPFEPPADESWLDIPGVVGMLAAVVFLVGSLGVFAVVSLLTHGRIEW